MKKGTDAPKRQAIEMRAKIQSAALTLFNREGFGKCIRGGDRSDGGLLRGQYLSLLQEQGRAGYPGDADGGRGAYGPGGGVSGGTGRRPARESRWTLWAGPRRSASDEMLYKAFIHGLRYPEQAVLQKNDKRVYYRPLRELVDLCQEGGSIHPSYDPDCLVEDLVVLHRGTLFEWRIYQEGFDIAKQGRRMADAPCGAGIRSPQKAKTHAVNKEKRLNMGAFFIFPKTRPAD